MNAFYGTNMPPFQGSTLFVSLTQGFTLCYYIIPFQVFLFYNNVLFAFNF